MPDFDPLSAEMVIDETDFSLENWFLTSFPALNGV